MEVCSCSLCQFGVTAPFLQQNVHGYERIGQQRMALDLHSQASALYVSVLISRRLVSIHARLMTRSGVSRGPAGGGTFFEGFMAAGRQSLMPSERASRQSAGNDYKGFVRRRER